MLFEVNPKLYGSLLPTNPHPFISEPFINLNKTKVNRVVRLVNNERKAVIGLVAGIEKGILKSPFSAPFGGFHFNNSNLYINEIDKFLSSLKQYSVSSNLEKIEITLPPDIYNYNINSKIVNAMIRQNYKMSTPEINNWINLKKFGNRFTQSNTKAHLAQAIRNSLCFNKINEIEKKREAFQLIFQNRIKFGRSLFMSFDDIIKTENIWPIDFFSVNSDDGFMLASAILYRNHSTIIYLAFWADNDVGRSLRAMDFLAFNLWNHYKSLGFEYLDAGISTELGIPNEGLLRFKEAHDCESSLRFNFTLNL